MVAGPPPTLPSGGSPFVKLGGLLGLFAFLWLWVAAYFAVQGLGLHNGPCSPACDTAWEIEDGLFSGFVVFSVGGLMLREQRPAPTGHPR